MAGLNETARIAKGILGEKLYQKRARAAFPILVRQATAQQKITYGDLAEELSIPNARNLNYVLGSVGITLLDLSRTWDEEIPAIQCLVVNSATGLPGEGVDNFLLGGHRKERLNRKQKEALVNKALGNVFAYPKWHRVLNALEIEPPKSMAQPFVEAARAGRGGGESKEHRLLKQHVARHPASIGLPASHSVGATEFQLPSGDAVDVLFKNEVSWIAVEVKSIISSEADIARGLFQCVKYRAVMDAWLGFRAKPIDCRAILALGGSFPKLLIPLRNALGIHVVENVRLVKSRQHQMRL